MSAAVFIEYSGLHKQIIKIQHENQENVYELKRTTKAMNNTLTQKMSGVKTCTEESYRYQSTI